MQIDPASRDALKRSSPTYSQVILLPIRRSGCFVRSGPLSCLPIIDSNPGNLSDLEAHFVNNDITKMLDIPAIE
jgi:hypothetical protein